MIKPADFLTTHPIELPNGETCSSDDVWAMLCASRDGDLSAIEALVSRCGGLVTCE